MGESLRCPLLLHYVLPEEPLGTLLGNIVKKELGDPNWTGGYLAGDLPRCSGTGEGPRTSRGGTRLRVGQRRWRALRWRVSTWDGKRDGLHLALPIHQPQPILVVF